MKKIHYLTFAALLTAACSSEPEFKVEGTVTGAEGQMLYLEASALEGIVPLDSVKLKGDGRFAFKQPRPAAPEFYRLRMGDRVVNFTIDSTEIVTIEAPYEGFSTAYTVSGSTNSERIKELTLKQAALQQQVDRLYRAVQARETDTRTFGDSLTAVIDAYKKDVRTNYIYAAPNTAAAYFALFQKLNNYLIFDPLNSKEDIKCFAAVATSLNNDYPHADRSRNLYNIVIKGMKNTRAPQQRTVDLPEGTVAEAGVIEINLRDMRGNTHRLSEQRGKAVILDFTIYQSAVSASHNYMLRDLYDKYADRGLEIYQVSLDADEHYWKTIADNLPWICVRDASGIYSSIAVAYNVQEVPTLFLINKQNELSARSENIKDLEAAVKALL